MSRYQAETWQSWYQADGLANNSVHALASNTTDIGSTSALWCGTREGLSRYDGRSWQTWTIADGLGAGWVRDIAIDTHGHLWLATEDGSLSRFKPPTPMYLPWLGR